MAMASRIARLMIPAHRTRADGGSYDGVTFRGGLDRPATGGGSQSSGSK